MNLRHHNARPDGVHQPGRNKADIPLPDRMAEQHILDPSGGNRRRESSAVYALPQPVNQFCPRLRRKNDPHFGLTDIVFHPRGVGIIGVHLHRKAILRVNQFNEQRKRAALIRGRHRIVAEACNHFIQRQPGKSAVFHMAHPVGAHRQFPRLTESIKRCLFSEQVFQTFPAPDPLARNVGNFHRIFFSHHALIGSVFNSP